MKCIKYIHTGEIRRVADSSARQMTKQNRWQYCPKSEWKETRRVSTAARAEEQAVKAPAKEKSDRGKWNKKKKKYEKA